MLAPHSAWKTIVAHTSPLPPVPQELSRAARHFLAENIVADRDIPPAPRSAMDGYALRAADVSGDNLTLRCIGEIPAGSDHAPEITSGTCARIFTGGNIPPGADAVLMQEYVETGEEDQILCKRPVKVGENIFKQAENACAGDVLIPAGKALGPGRIGVCAAVGVATPVVHALPKVAVLATGEELLDAAAAAAAHQLRNSNGPTLEATLAEHGFPVTRQIAVADDPKLICARLEEALDANDVVITTGGVSVGDYDFVPAAIARVKGTVHYHGVAIKPGKPQLFATTDKGKCIFGLPGNPLSSLIGLHEFVLPALRRLAGSPISECRPTWQLPINALLRSKGTRVQHVLVKIVNGPNGMAVEPVPTEGSADLVAGGAADGTAIIPIGTQQVEPDSIVDVRPWRWL